ncbi:hypothetical protein SISSUDRAFT_1055612 [Sistotremastrum suecicum HHB10207 ss-3]|uniref:Uncharacterized protein n=1 Tax=Sistotremastrum suecicum HHB10207 ss-3 TaxID=1314776 RepID=A0A165XNK8_9AGAM|nr:hypothetical protein SISSUDRAFT_1055612 [Sistotremastrum suecicum HHB10207 ss-3]
MQTTYEASEKNALPPRSDTKHLSQVQCENQKIKRVTRSNPKLEPSRGQHIRDQQAKPNDHPDNTPRPTRAARIQRLKS